MAYKMKGFYMIYSYETEQAVALCETIEEVRRFLDYKNTNVVNSAISHFMAGHCQYLRDGANRRYTIAKIND